MSDEPWNFFANSEETMGARNRSSIYLIDISSTFCDLFVKWSRWPWHTPVQTQEVSYIAGAGARSLYQAH